MWNRGMFSKACTDTQEEISREVGKRDMARKWQDAAAAAVSVEKLCQEVKKVLNMKAALAVLTLLKRKSVSKS